MVNILSINKKLVFLVVAFSCFNVSRLFATKIACVLNNADSVMDQSLLQNNNECPICFDALTEDSTISLCEGKHSFHLECLSKPGYKQTNCPICRQNISDEHMAEINQSFELAMSERERSEETRPRQIRWRRSPVSTFEAGFFSCLTGSCCSMFTFICFPACIHGCYCCFNPPVWLNFAVSSCLGSATCSSSCAYFVFEVSCD
ncbi:MAG: hypothetical protein CMP11_02475 [Zetaproteobacteria bacterium]|nr:hypothetical protein [Pseudobdellovibrionaceae bacterium]